MALRTPTNDDWQAILWDDKVTAVITAADMPSYTQGRISAVGAGIWTMSPVNFDGDPPWFGDPHWDNDPESHWDIQIRWGRTQQPGATWSAWSPTQVYVG